MSNKKPLDGYCEHGHQMSPGELLARYCQLCLWDEISRLTAELDRMRERADGAEASSLNCGDCYDKDVELDRMRPVVEAARTQREHHDAECLCVVCLALRALDGEP